MLKNRQFINTQLPDRSVFINHTLPIGKKFKKYLVLIDLILFIKCQVCASHYTYRKETDKEDLICLGKSHLIIAFNSSLRHLMFFQRYMVLAGSPNKLDFYLSLLPEISLDRIIKFSFLVEEKQLIKNSCCLPLFLSFSLTCFLPGLALPRRQPHIPLPLFVFFLSLVLYNKMVPNLFRT